MIRMAAAHVAAAAHGTERAEPHEDRAGATHFGESIQGALERLLASMPATHAKAAPRGRSFEGTAETPPDDAHASGEDHDSGVFVRAGEPRLDAAVLAALATGAIVPESTPTMPPAPREPSSGVSLASVAMSMALAAPVERAGHELAATALTLAESALAEPDADAPSSPGEASRSTGAPSVDGGPFDGGSSEGSLALRAPLSSEASSRGLSDARLPSSAHLSGEHARDPRGAHATGSVSRGSSSSPDASAERGGDLRGAGETRGDRGEHASHEGARHDGAHHEGARGEGARHEGTHVPVAVDAPRTDVFARLDAPADRAPTPAVAPTPPAEALVSPELQDLPAHAMHFASLDAQQGARVELMHPSLGRIDVDVRADGQHVDVALLSRSLGASIALRAAEQGLRGDLRARGSELRSYRVRTDASRHASTTPTATEEEENDE
jgi:hypothetical protein